MSENAIARDKCKENNPTENIESLSLKGNKPPRPQRLPFKTRRFYDVKLPTYEESQKYEKFLYTLEDADKEQKQFE